MLSPHDIENRIRDRHMQQLKAAEDQIDAALEEHWEERFKGISVTFEPPIHRLIMDELAKKYHGPGKYNVEYRRKRPVTATNQWYEYDTLEFKPYSEPVHSEL